MLFTRRRLLRSLQLFCGTGLERPTVRRFRGRAPSLESLVGFQRAATRHAEHRSDLATYPYEVYSLCSFTSLQTLHVLFFSFMDSNAAVKRSPKENVWFLAAPTPTPPSFTGTLLVSHVADKSQMTHLTNKVPVDSRDIRRNVGNIAEVRACLRSLRAHARTEVGIGFLTIRLCFRFTITYQHSLWSEMVNQKSQKDTFIH